MNPEELSNSPEGMLTDEMRERAQFILERLGFKSFEELKGFKILDVGSGPSYFGKVAKEELVDVISFDYRAEMNVDVVGSARRLPFQNEVFDMVVTHAGPFGLGQENAENSLGYVKEYQRVLKSGGKIRISPGISYGLLGEYIREHKAVLPEKYPLKDFPQERLAEITLEKLHEHNISTARLLERSDKDSPILEITKGTPR